MLLRLPAAGVSPAAPKPATSLENSQALASLPYLQAGGGAGIGSNAIAFGGDATGTRHGLLFGNPQACGANRWDVFWAHLQSAKGGGSYRVPASAADPLNNAGRFAF